MIGSTIQQGTQGSTASVNFVVDKQELANLMGKIRDSIDKIPIPAEAKQELTCDIQTTETQLSSTRPKATVITSCLGSIKTILENAAGNILASGLVIEIDRFLKLHHL
jgi:hypothetical protein